MGKEKVVADALCWKEVNMGSLAYLPMVEQSLALDIQSLVNGLVRLDILSLRTNSSLCWGLVLPIGLDYCQTT